MEDFKNLNVDVVCVSKFRSQEEIDRVKKEGFTIFAENRVQELKKKAVENPDVLWHLIGHLQTNKVKDAVKYAELIHSVDSLHLLEEINKEAHKQGKIQDVLIQINIAREEQKFGIDETELFSFVSSAAVYSDIRIHGIMVIAPNTENFEWIDMIFAEGSRLFEELKLISQNNVQADILSMGMSHDYPIAIKNHATCIRVGTALFNYYNTKDTENGNTLS